MPCDCKFCRLIEAYMEYVEGKGRPKGSTGIDNIAKSMFEGVSYYDLSTQDKRIVIGSMISSVTDDPEDQKNPMKWMRERIDSIFKSLVEKGNLPDTVELVQTDVGPVVISKNHPMLDEIKRTGKLPEDGRIEAERQAEEIANRIVVSRNRMNN